MLSSVLGTCHTVIRVSSMSGLITNCHVSRWARTPCVGTLTGSEPPNCSLSSLLWAKKHPTPAVSDQELWGGRRGEQGGCAWR